MMALVFNVCLVSVALCNIMIQSTVLFNAYLEGTKINTEVNERPLKNIGMHLHIRHCSFQRVVISFSLAK